MAKFDPSKTDYSDAYITEEAERIIPRNDWNAVDAREENPLANPVSYVVVGYTGTPTCDNSFKCYESMFTLQKVSILEKKLHDIPYNFIVAGTGFVYEGRGWTVQPHLPPRLCHLEDRALYIGLIGDKESIAKDDEMVEEVYGGARELVRYGMDHDRITRKILLYTIS